MPFKPKSPQIETVMVPSDRAVDEYHIHEHRVATDPNNPTQPSVIVTWSKGFRDAAGIYRAVRMIETAFQGPEVLASVTQTVTGGSTRYDEIKAAIWDLLINGDLPDQDKLPAGSVE